MLLLTGQRSAAELWLKVGECQPWVSCERSLFVFAFLLIDTLNPRLGPLSLEQKKRLHVQRQKAEKNDAEAKAPQQLKEEDIQRSENETTKNVIEVSVRLITVEAFSSS